MTTLDEKLKDVNVRLNEVTAEMQGLLTAISESKEPLEEMGSAMVDFSANYEQSMTLMERLITAVSNIKIPAAQVVVNPTPIQNNLPAPVVQILERVQPGAYQLNVKYDNHDRITSATLTPVSPK